MCLGCVCVCVYEPWEDATQKESPFSPPFQACLFSPFFSLSFFVILFFYPKRAPLSNEVKNVQGSKVPIFFYVFFGANKKHTKEIKKNGLKMDGNILPAVDF